MKSILDPNYNILSLFNGMGCGSIALDELGANPNKYYSSEIDKYSIAVAQDNYPNTIQVGDILNWRDWEIDWSSIDLVIGGSPCQGFSLAGKRLAFEDPRSALVIEYFDILDHIRSLNPDVKFLLENVKMKQQDLHIITQCLGVEPIMINSSLVSAQNRRRMYWCNWDICQPNDKLITWGDVREFGIDSMNFYYTQKAMGWLSRSSQKRNKTLTVHRNDEKMQMLEASHYKKYSNQRFFGICDFPKNYSYHPNIPIFDNGGVGFRYNNVDNYLSTLSKDNNWMKFTLPNRIPLEEFMFRYITPIECERLQTVPDNYTSCVSNTQRYKMLGNGWTVDIIVHLLRGLIL